MSAYAMSVHDKALRFLLQIEDGIWRHDGLLAKLLDLEDA